MNQDKSEMILATMNQPMVRPKNERPVIVAEELKKLRAVAKAAACIFAEPIFGTGWRILNNDAATAFVALQEALRAIGEDFSA